MDEGILMKAEIDRRNALAAGKQPNETEEEEKEKTRKKSDKNVKNYRKLVVADNDELTQKYRNEYRGKIQKWNWNLCMHFPTTRRRAKWSVP